MRVLSYNKLRDEKGITYSRTHLRRISDPTSKWYLNFPAPIKIGPGRIGWDSNAVDEFLRMRFTICERARESHTRQLMEKEKISIDPV